MEISMLEAGIALAVVGVVVFIVWKKRDSARAMKDKIVGKFGGGGGGKNGGGTNAQQ
jgi:hypothetical protein